MHIAIDARMIRPGTMHGIARYVFNLLRELVRINSAHKLSVFVSADSPLLSCDFRSDLNIVVCKAPWISIREHFEIPLLLKKMKVDLFHAPSYVAPYYTHCKMVMTIHDLNHLVLPQFYTPLHQLYYRFIVIKCIKRSEAILTVSQFSKREIINHLNMGEKKIFVTYNGVSNRYGPVEDKLYREYVRDIYELPEEFILCVSNNKPHKNINLLVRGYCQADLNLPLVLASPVSQEAIETAECYGKKHLLYFTKFIDEEHLPAVYSMTKLFVFPSTYEGFGLPPLEALACGTPVVVSRSSSLPEVVGDQAIFTDPYDYREIAEALKTGVNNESRRQELIKKGPAHAKMFRWETMAADTLAIYNLAGGQPEVVGNLSWGKA